jgi:hypothetical protein
MVGSDVSGCTKDDRPQVAELVAQVQHVREWRYDPDAAKRHVPWLRANIAWDILGAQTMTSVEDAGALGSDVDAILKSGLAELAAGPAPRDMIAELDHWRVVLGRGTCESSDATTDDAAWLRAQLGMPVPAGAGEGTRAALRGYVSRAAFVRARVRIRCGGTAALVVGTVDGKLVPLLHE